ncbi:MAG: dienelactone hydrolase family protein [Paraburkholderia sp.]
MDAYRVAPDGDAARPTVIVLHEIFGVNGSMRDVAEMLAHEGFEVLIPDLFWRAAPRISLGYVEPDRTRAGELLRHFDTDLGLTDIGRLVAWLKQRDGAGHRVAAIGFCIGGKLATLLGARGEIDAGVSFYGIQLNDYVDEIASAKSRLLLHFGGQDAQIPLDLVNRIEAASKPNPLVDVRVYPEAKHGFFNPTRADRYHAHAAREAGTRTLAMLREVLDLPTAP